MNYVLRRNGVGPGLVDIPEFSKTGLIEINKDEKELPADAKYVFRWGTTSNIPGEPKVLNSAKSIHKVFDKRNFRMELGDLAPQTWNSFETFLEDSMVFPVIVRPAQHSRSENLFVCQTASEVYKAVKKFPDHYISKFIQKTNEYRVMFCSGRVIGVIEKIPQNKKAASWGCVDDGNFKYINWEDWPLMVVTAALQAVKVSGLDFGAVDVITDAERPYVLEINSSAWLSPYFCKIFTEAFDFIVLNGPDQIPYVQTQNFYGYIHPSRYKGAAI